MYMLTVHLLQSAKHIYIGETAALQGPGFKKGRPGNASIMGMTRMTPRALAYVAVQVCYKALFIMIRALSLHNI